jgi:hypothetical protein
MDKNISPDKKIKVLRNKIDLRDLMGFLKKHIKPSNRCNKIIRWVYLNSQVVYCFVVMATHLISKVKLVLNRSSIECNPCLFCFVLGFTSHRHSIGHIATFQLFTGRGRPQVPFRALFQARTGTWVEPPTFRK